ncbi:MAG TPA: Gfo/Idh/MocA family oxidoreductase [Pyrinomonadaceae bacterium]|nr:Gfo/Idh/MocA family oxidoreductase [Pyrinomonadaceae bacterium]
MDKPQKPSRRRFIKLATATTLAAGASRNIFSSTTTLISPSQEPSKPVSPNDRIRIATIGMGGQGTSDTKAALHRPGETAGAETTNPAVGEGVELVAVADLYEGRLIRAKEVFGKDLFTTRDYREILARPDVDAVLIVTPDHWHMKMAVDAMNAGKDVYLEKPMVQDLDEGKRVIETARKTNRILQVGSQRVSSIVYQKAKDLYNSGGVGELNLVEAWWNRNSAIGAWQYTIPPDASPATVDWDRFLHDAPKVPFDPVRFFRWRNYRDYGTGVAGDLFVHLFSGMHFVLSSNGPTRVMSVGGLRHWRDGRDVPDVMLGVYEYPKTDTHPGFNLSLKVNFADGGGGEEGFRFVGSAGMITIGRGGVTLTRKPLPKEPGLSINTFPKAMQDALQKEYRAKYPESRVLGATMEETYVAPQGYSDLVDHFKNFFEAVRTRKPVVEDAVFGFRAAGPALVTNLSYLKGRSFEWDPEAMRVKD